MVYIKKNSENNAICQLDIAFNNTALVFFGLGNFNRFPISNFVVEVSTKNGLGIVTSRENMLITSRVGNQFNIGTRAYEAVPLDDTQTSNIQQALSFGTTNTVITQVISKVLLDNIQDSIITQETKGTNIASASSVNIGASLGHFIDITGTTTITSFGNIQAGIKRTLRFTGILTLTHNATSLILPSGVNIVTLIGDTCDMISLGGGNWLCSDYQRSDGTSLVSFVISKSSCRIALSGNQAISANVKTKVLFNTIKFNTGDFNTTTNTYIAPSNGKYNIFVDMIQIATTTGGFSVLVEKNGAILSDKYEIGTFIINTGLTVDLVTGDTIIIYVYANTNPVTLRCAGGVYGAPGSSSLLSIAQQ